MISPSIAILGAGPAGCYAADQLVRKVPDARIDVFDRLPTPFGLVRGGVAPDHQGTKSIVRQFERTFQKPNVRFVGHVEIGRDLEFPNIQDAYDSVIVATGALEDRVLGIPGEGLPGVVGSGRFVAWYNGIPDAPDLSPLLAARSVAVIGNGNVALDIVRLLGKSRADLEATDMARDAVEAISTSPLADIWLIGRRGPAEASFTSPELAELGELARVSISVHTSSLPESPPAGMDDAAARIASRNLEILRGFGQSPAGRPVRLHLLFHAAPVCISGVGRVQELVLKRTGPQGPNALTLEEDLRVPADLVVSAVGYRGRPLSGLPFDEARGTVANRDGMVAPGVYATGWCRRGPRGVIPANRADALGVADRVAADLAMMPRHGRPGPQTVDRLLQSRGVETVSFAGWKRIDAAEVARGTAAGRPREKIFHAAELLAVANAT